MEISVRTRRKESEGRLYLHVLFLSIDIAKMETRPWGAKRGKGDRKGSDRATA